MALSNQSVTNAIEILREVNPRARLEEREWSEAERGLTPENVIIAYDRKGDGGFENVLIYVRDITPEQIEIFDSQKEKVHNSAIFRDEGNGITVVGWF